MDSVRERANLFLYQSAICTECRSLFNCFEIARFVHTQEDDYKPIRDRYAVVPLGRILFRYSIETNASGDATTFNLMFAIKGFLVFFKQFCPCFVVRKPHFHYVASRHELVIQFLHSYSCFNSCVWPRIKLLFPLHSLCAPICLYLFHLEKRSLEAIVGEHIGENENPEKENERNNSFVLFFGHLVFNNHRCLVESFFTPWPVRI